MLAWHVRRERERDGVMGSLPMANLLRNSNGHIFSSIDEAHIKSWAEQFRKLPGIMQMQGPKQWRNLKSEVTRLTSLGYIPPHGSRLKNAIFAARERIVRFIGA